MVLHQPRRARPHLGGDVTSTQLPSGLRLITENMPGSHTLALGFFIPVGSRHEADGEWGCAHFLEHALFKGTPTRTAADISATFDAIGGEANAFTSKEYTCFHAKVLADDTDLAVDVLLDMLTNSVLSASDIDDERAVIMDEMAMHADDPQDTAYHAFARHLFGTHPLARPVIGTAASVTGLSDEGIRDFWHRHYRADQVVVSAAGSVDHARLARLLECWQAPQQAPRPGVSTSAPSATSGGLSVEERALEQTSCIMGFPGVGSLDPDRYALNLLAMVLGGGMSSRLFLEVREYRGLTYHIDASLGSYTDGGQFTIEWQSSPGVVMDICQTVADVVADVVRDGITEAELERAKGQFRGQTLLAFEAPETRMMRLGRSVLWNDPRTMNDVLDATEAVTAVQVQEAAKRYLTGRPTFSAVGALIDADQVSEFVTTWTEKMASA